MSRLKIPVPHGFTLTTDVCKDFYASNQMLPIGLKGELEEALGRLELATGRKFGDERDPLLVSVRSGAPVSMPGMMDTILNLGMTSKCVEGFAALTGNERFAWDTYRRLVQMFGDVVMGVSAEKFEEILTKTRTESKANTDAGISAQSLKGVTARYMEMIYKETGKHFPDDPHAQLFMAVEAIFRSWNTPRAVSYRRIHDIPNDLGTAVTIQAMVFGNRENQSGTGVVFTRNPSTGDPGLIGEYLLNAQGEDVVAGTRTPAPINDGSRSGKSEGETLERKMPEVYGELLETSRRLETYYTDMQDIEFTIEEGELWLLQARAGKRTAAAAVKIAVDLVHEGVAHRRDVLKRIRPSELDQLLHPVFDPSAIRNVLARGLPASPGAASGKVVFTAEDAEAWDKKGEKVVLVRMETSPEDIGGMHVAQAILTSRGGMTSHAAVVARGMGKCCVVGCNEISVNAGKKSFVTEKGVTIVEGTLISVDGSSGEVISGSVPTVQAELGESFSEFMAWADEIRTMKVRANADTPADCRMARKFGAQGIGLCRTEHMFFHKDRIDIVRQMILAETTEARNQWLAKILPMQLEDFREIFREMLGLPVTIRLLDPPLHEFLPHTQEEAGELARRVGGDSKEIWARVEALREFNPMLGLRGCRVGITFPEIYDMQVAAIMQAACEIEAESSAKVFPEIMVPLVVDPQELALLRERIVAVAEKIKSKYRSHLRYWIGTMIELPRAALMAGEIAKKADFFSFGTNDLTQTTYGLSRDDSSRFLPQYIEKGIFKADPFSTIDPYGVLELVRIGTERGRQANPILKVGVCGEHGGDPDSIQLFQELGLNYVSCSPYRVPLARLKAAQVSLESSESSDTF